MEQTSFIINVSFLIFVFGGYFANEIEPVILLGFLQQVFFTNREIFQDCHGVCFQFDEHVHKFFRFQLKLVHAALDYFGIFSGGVLHFWQIACFLVQLQLRLQTIIQIGDYLVILLSEHKVFTHLDFQITLKYLLNVSSTQLIQLFMQKQASEDIQAHPQFKIDMPIDTNNHRYPYCIVWTALPCLTCCLPCIGHTGICKSNGVIYDFVGRGPMHSGQLAFGAPLKYFQLDHSNYSSEEWDDSIAQANEIFSKTNHNLITNNCHHHVAEVLNKLKYKGKDNWGQVDIAIMMIKGTHTGWLSYWIYLVFVIVVLLLLF